MPLGAFRINGLAKTSAVGGSVVNAEVYYSQISTNLIDSGASAVGSNIAFCGFDQDDKAVYIAIWIDTTHSTGTAVLFNIDLTDGTVTTGSEYTYYSGSSNSILHPAVITENEHANLRLDLTTSDTGVIGWRQWSGAATNRFYARTVTFDIDNLTMTFGSIEGFSDAITNNTFAFLAYSGTSGQYTFMCRGGNNGVFPVYTLVSRSGTSLSVVGSPNQTIGSAGQWGVGEINGVKNDRFIFTANGNNRDRVEFQAGKWVSNTVYGTAQNIQEDNETNTYQSSTLLNATDSYLNIRYETQQTPTNTQVEAGVVDWKTGTTAPTVTQTNQIEVDSVARSRLGSANGAYDGEAYAWHWSGTNSDMKLYKFSISGTTLTQEFSKTWSQSWLSDGQVENDNHTFIDSNNNIAIVSFLRRAGYPYVRVIVDPDGL